MAITYGFFNSVNGDRKYSAEQIGRYLQGIVSSGVYADSSTSLQVLANDGMNVEVQPGRAMLHYHYMENDAPLVLTLSAGGALDRIDAIVARMDITRRLCEIVVKQGAEASTPAAPTMSRTDTVKEYMLARVRIPRLTSTITQANITDTRADKTVCGWVTGVIEQVDTSTLFAQWEDAYNAAVAEMGAALEEQQQTFEKWYESLTGNYADGTVLPIPTPADAGKLPTVKTDGSGYELKAPDSTLTNPGQAADAAAVGRALTAANLLDNGDFTNPVNMSGKTSHTGIGYCIDKWFSSSGYGTITVNPGYVNIKSTNGTSAAYLLQFVEADKIKNGKKYTAACKLKDGSLHCVSAEASTDMAEAVKYIYVNGAQLGTIRIKYDAGQAKYAVLFSVTTTGGMDVEHVALYEGEYTTETLPIYRPRGYSLEAAACGVAGSAVVLWENASPGASFAEQTLALNVSKYKYFVITLRSDRDADYYYSCVIDNLPGVDQFLIGYSGADRPSKLLSRRVKVVSGGLWFSGVVIEGEYTPSNASNIAYPHKIYGVI